MLQRLNLSRLRSLPYIALKINELVFIWEGPQSYEFLNVNSFHKEQRVKLYLTNIAGHTVWIKSLSQFPIGYQTKRSKMASEKSLMRPFSVWALSSKHHFEIILPRSALFHMKTRVCLKHFVNDYIWRQFLASNSIKTLSSLICLTILVTLRSLAQF